jgi:hypothetical protein
MQRKIQ